MHCKPRKAPGYEAICISVVISPGLKSGRIHWQNSAVTVLQGMWNSVCCLFLEYHYVQNAFFTDPSDQSAWFYHRWLLGRSMSLFEMCLCLLTVSWSHFFQWACRIGLRAHMYLQSVTLNFCCHFVLANL